MSRIRSKWTKQEKTVHNFLKGMKIKHKMHPKIPGNPDILITEKTLVVFLHGCFWHKCPKCFKEPKSNKKYWIPKIERNVERDRENILSVRKHGYKALNLWEHDINIDITKIIEKLIRYEKGNKRDRS